MKNMLTSFWLWGFLLVAFVSFILWDDSLQKKIAKSYLKHRMNLTNVNFSQVDNGFEQAKIFAETVNMDENQNNMNASTVKAYFFKKENASFTGTLLSEKALKNPFEIKFWGNIRAWTTDEDKLKTEELRYYFSRKELYTQKPVKIWKDNAVITGVGLRYKTESKEAHINQNVKIRIWNDNASKSKDIAESNIETKMPEAPSADELLKISQIKNNSSESEKIGSISENLNTQEKINEKQ
ncbi:MAG: LPS export ABC transporter periplasmic protein LptC [Candidatus Rifleibacteriota bacterium]